MTSEELGHGGREEKLPRACVGRTRERLPPTRPCVAHVPERVCGLEGRLPSVSTRCLLKATHQVKGGRGLVGWTSW